MTASTRDLHYLNQHSLRSFGVLFSSLAPPALTAMHGFYQATFVGPWWLRTVAGPGLYPLGLGGWWGKQFDGRGQGSNIISRGGRLITKMPVQLIEQPSRIDGRSCLAVIYPSGSPFPWPWVIDELRLLDDEHLLGGQQVLGMTLVTLRPLNHIALPFLLAHRPEMHTL